ncbi:MAG: SprB repeat-containing protein [Flavobacteriales bacterium]|nr:SprB repeat-containing protein [Flavobacteriales bacterium]
MRHGLTSLWLLGPGAVLIALMLGSCAKVDYEEETVTQTFEDPTVFEVDCGSLEVSLVATPDDGSGTGSVSADVSGGTPPYSYAWLDSTGAVAGMEAAVINVPAGTYTFEVTDDWGCISGDTIDVEFMDLALEGEVVIMSFTSNSPTPSEVTLLCDPPALNVPSVLTVQPGMTEVPFAFPENTTEVHLTYSWTCGNMTLQGPGISVYGEGGSSVGGAFVPIAIGC